MALRTLYFDGVDAPVINGAASARLLRSSSAGLTAAGAATTLSGITSAQYSKLSARGGTTVASSAAVPPPSGIGYILDDESMTGSLMEYNSAGTNNAKITLTMSGSVSAQITLRLWILRASGAYDRLGEMNMPSTTVRNTTTHTLTGTLFRGPTFNAGDRLYMELEFYFYGNTAQTRTATWNQGGGATGSITFDTITVDSLRPINDDFVNAIDMTGDSGSTAAIPNTYSTRQVGEPEFGTTDRTELYRPHATTGVCTRQGTYTPWSTQDTGSLWWKWTCPVPEAGVASKVDMFNFRTRGAKFIGPSNYALTHVRVYTGPSVDQLTIVERGDSYIAYDETSWNDFRFPNTCSSDAHDEGVWSNVELKNPVPGTTYYFRAFGLTYDTQDTYYAQIPAQWATYARTQDWIQDPLDRTLLSPRATAEPSGQLGYGTGAFGYWEMWHSYGNSIEPGLHEPAHDCMSEHAMRGSRSLALNNNTPDQGGWNEAGYGWVEPHYAPGSACAPLPPPFIAGEGTGPGEPYEGYPSGLGSMYGGINSGSRSSTFSQPSVSYANGCLFLTPDGPSRANKHWAAKSDPRHALAFPGQTEPMPAGAIGVIYERPFADIVNVRVRPSTATGAGVAYGKRQTIVGEWRHIPTRIVPMSSGVEYGWFMRPRADNNLDMEWHHRFKWNGVHTGEAGLGPLIGTISFDVNQVRTQITDTWYQVAGASRPVFDFYESATVPSGGTTSPNPYVMRQDRAYVFPFIADHVRDEETHGMGGSRLIQQVDLECEVIYRPPRYAYLYGGRRIPDACSYPTVEPVSVQAVPGPPRGGFE